MIPPPFAQVSTFQTLSFKVDQFHLASTQSLKLTKAMSLTHQQRLDITRSCRPNTVFYDALSDRWPHNGTMHSHSSLPCRCGGHTREKMSCCLATGPFRCGNKVELQGEGGASLFPQCPHTGFIKASLRNLHKQFSRFCGPDCIITGGPF